MIRSFNEKLFATFVVLEGTLISTLIVNINEIEKLQKLDVQSIPSTQNFFFNSILNLKISVKFSTNITKTFETIGFDIKIAFRTTKVGNYFSLKNRINKFY